MSAPLTVAEALSRAADFLEAPGAWTQGSFGSENCHCMLGAVAAVLGVDPHKDVWRSGLAGRAYNLLKLATGDGVPERWNDAAERTQAEVVAALRAAALKAGAE